MEKQFLVYIENIPTLNIILSDSTTLGEIKNHFHSLYKNYKIKFLINPHEELKVFETEKYDSLNLSSLWNKIENGSIYLEKNYFSLPKDIEEKTITKFRSEKSYNGYNTSDLKSWLQKDIRRSNVEGAVWAAVELYTLNEQRIVTNLFNRIRIICMEDIGIANPLIVKIVSSVLEKLEIHGKPRLPVTENDVINLAELISYMARSEHLRMASDYKAVFMTPDIRKELIKKFPQIYKNHDKYINENSKNPKILGEKMVQLLIEKNDAAFYMMAKILDFEKLSFKTYRSNHPAYYILSLIEDLGKNLKYSPETDILVKWLKGGIINSKIDYNLPLYHAMLMILKRDEIEESKVTMEKVEIKNFLKGTILQIPDYALDKHTLKGLRKGKTAIDFAKEGALVENESKLLNKEYRKVYFESKYILEKEVKGEREGEKEKEEEVKEKEEEEGEKESDVFDFDVRVQATVTDYRQDTYLATERKTGRYVFVKGPYKTEEEIDIPINISGIKSFLAPELSNIKLEKIKLFPDLFPNLPWGIRRHLDRNIKYWFLVSESLIKNPAPRMKHNTKKWGDVEVIDYSKIEEPKKPEILKLKGKGEALYQYVLNVLFRYALGIPDFADRNFMLMKDGRIFATDEEGFNKTIDVKAKIGNKKSEYILDYIKKEWKNIEKNISEWKIRSIDLKSKWITKNLEKLEKIGNVIKIFQ